MVIKHLSVLLHEINLRCSYSYMWTR